MIEASQKSLTNWVTQRYSDYLRIVPPITQKVVKTSRLIIFKLYKINFTSVVLNNLDASNVYLFPPILATSVVWATNCTRCNLFTFHTKIDTVEFITLQLERKAIRWDKFHIPELLVLAEIPVERLYLVEHCKRAHFLCESEVKSSPPFLRKPANGSISSRAVSWSFLIDSGNNVRISTPSCSARNVR